MCLGLDLCVSSTWKLNAAKQTGGCGEALCLTGAVMRCNKEHRNQANYFSRSKLIFNNRNSTYIIFHMNILCPINPDCLFVSAIISEGIIPCRLVECYILCSFYILFLVLQKEFNGSSLSEDLRMKRRTFSNICLLGTEDFDCGCKWSGLVVVPKHISE